MPYTTSEARVELSSEQLFIILNQSFRKYVRLNPPPPRNTGLQAGLDKLAVVEQLNLRLQVLLLVLKRAALENKWKSNPFSPTATSQGSDQHNLLKHTQVVRLGVLSHTFPSPERECLGREIGPFCTNNFDSHTLASTKRHAVEII